MDFVLGVAASLVASIILLFVANSRNWIVIDKRRKQLALARRLTAIGMTNFFASRADYSRYRSPGRIVDYIGSARHRVDIVAYWMGHANEAESIPRSIIDLLQRKPALVIRIALIDPDGKYVEAVSDYLGIPLRELQARLTASLDNLLAARAVAAPHVQGRLSVLTYSQMPVASVIMLDYGAERGARIQLDFKPYRRPRSESFAFELTSPSALYSTCSEAWIAMLNDADPYPGPVARAGPP